MPVDGEAVVRVALRPRPHVLPFGEQTHEHTHVIERLEDANRIAPGPEQRDERVAPLVGPLDRLHRGNAIERLAFELRALLGGPCGQRKHAWPVDRCLGVERDAPVAQADAITEVAQPSDAMARALLRCEETRPQVRR